MLFSPRDLRRREDNIVRRRWTIGIRNNKGRRRQEANLAPVGVDHESTLGLVHRWVLHDPLESRLHIGRAVVYLRGYGGAHQVPQRHGLH